MKSKIGIGKKIPFLFLYDMEVKHKENSHPNRVEVIHRFLGDMSPKKDKPLKEYEDINYLENQVEDISQ